MNQLSNRQRKALQAARSIANQHGLETPTERVLRDSSHITIQLSPSLVGRAIVEDNDEGTCERMHREVAVLSHLAREGAPVVCPSDEVEPGPHLIDGVWVTFWKYEMILDESPDEADAVAALKRCHSKLASYPGELPSYLENVIRCHRQLDSPAAAAFLTVADHEFLRRVFTECISAVSVFPLTAHLHGDCHLGNALVTDSGIRWCDFESVCRGPIEWDMSSFPKTASRVYPVDENLLARFSFLRSCCVATWCWTLYDRSCEKRDAAQYHLNWLKREMGQQIERGNSE